MTWTGHKTEAVFRRYNIKKTDDLERAADMLAAYRDAKVKALTETGDGRDVDVVVH
jgi:trans-aconitate methyltransferase